MISLAPLPVTAVDSVLHLKIAPGQDAFVAPIAKMTAERHDSVHFHVIRRSTEVVGFFKIDLYGAVRPEFAIDGDIGLRGFLIGAQYQRQGIGSRAAVLLRPYLTAHYPDAQSLVLTVGTANRPAQRVYLEAGLVDTGRLWHGGRAGPEHVYRLALTAP